jgi:hypothetical protein
MVEFQSLTRTLEGAAKNWLSAAMAVIGGNRLVCVNTGEPSQQETRWSHMQNGDYAECKAASADTPQPTSAFIDPRAFGLIKPAYSVNEILELLPLGAARSTRPSKIKG